MAMESRTYLFIIMMNLFRNVSTKPRRRERGSRRFTRLQRKGFSKNGSREDGSRSSEFLEAKQIWDYDLGSSVRTGD